MAYNFWHKVKIFVLTIGIKGCLKRNIANVSIHYTRLQTPWIISQRYSVYSVWQNKWMPH